MDDHVEDVATSPFILSLDFADQIANNYKHSACYLSQQEEVLRLKTDSKPTDIRNAYFKGHHHAFTAAEDLQDAIKELLEFYQCPPRTLIKLL
jgi:hypothetical protein